MSLFDALALENAEARLATADLSPSARREVDALQTAVNGYQEDVRLLDTLLAAVDANTELSDEGRRRRRDEVIQMWADEAEQTLNSLDATAARLVPNAEAQITPPPLHADAQLAEARLSAAERHTQMMLDTVPTAELPDRLAELAGSDAYPDVGYLLSATPFGRMYLESRGVMGESGTEWEARRLEALRPRLSAAAQRALDDLPGLREAAHIPASLRGLHDENRLRYRVPRN
jgi:hypothetical protein